MLDYLHAINHRPGGHTYMALHNIECQSCGDEVRVRVANTLNCYKCRILSEWDDTELDPENTEYHAGVKADPLPKYSKTGNWKVHPRDCLCGRRFWPLRKNNTSCYYCFDARAGRRDEHLCNRCEMHNMPAPGLDATCMDCVQGSYAARRGYLHKVLTDRAKEKYAQAKTTFRM